MGRQVFCPVGGKVTSETIKKYIQYQKHEEKTPKRLKFDFKCPVRKHKVLYQKNSDPKDAIFNF